jgi:hypothetical protein
MKTIKILFFAILVLASGIFTSCEIDGLQLVKPYKYQHTILPNPKVDTTALGFIQRRYYVDMFNLLELIKYAEMEAEYNTPDRTYILANDVSMLASMKSQRFISSADMKAGWSKAQVKTWLSQYIVLNGANRPNRYLTDSLTRTPLKVECLNPAYIMTLSWGSISNQSYLLRVNELSKSNTAPAYTGTTAITSNIQVTNGVIHVMEAGLPVTYKY